MRFILIYECKEPAQHNTIWYIEIEHKGQRMYMEYDEITQEAQLPAS